MTRTEHNRGAEGLDASADPAVESAIDLEGDANQHGARPGATTAPRPAAQRSYLEHVALRVHDIHWHIRFFREVLGMDLREVDGPADDPRQVWTIGGVQLVSTPGFSATASNSQGWLAHLGIMVEDLDRALRAAEGWGAKALAQGPNWLQLPDGLAIELMQATGSSVAQALAVDPRA